MATYNTVPTHSPGDTLSADDWNDVGGDLNTFVGTGIGCRVYNSGNVSTTSTPAAVTFDSERWDTDSMHSTSSNTSRITFVTAGIYIISAAVEYQADSGNGLGFLNIKINGTNIISEDKVILSSGGTRQHTTTTIYQAAANDYAELFVASTNSITINNTAQYSPEFMAARV